MLVVALVVAMTIAVLIASMFSLREEAEPGLADKRRLHQVVVGDFADRAGGLGAPAQVPAFTPAVHRAETSGPRR